MRLGRCTGMIFLVAVVTTLIAPFIAFSCEDENQISSRVKEVQTLLSAKNSRLKSVVESTHSNEEFLNAGAYFSSEETDSLLFKVTVSDTTSPTIVLEPSPVFCGAETTNPLQKHSFIFECKNTTDECEGYSISEPEKHFFLKRVSSSRFIFKSANRIYLLAKSGAINFLRKLEAWSSKTPAQRICENLKVNMTSDFKSDCRACGGNVSKMTFEFQENPWTNTDPGSLLKPYSCRVRVKAYCPLY